ncbi:MAG TPA: hypothetical protein VF211_14690 [Burkholderiales bacterium]
MSALRVFALAAVLLLPFAAQADGTVKLYCAARATGLYDAEVQLRSRGPHFVNVTFMRTRPSRVVIDWALRDCLKTAAKLDDSRDIVAFAWFRPHARAALQLLEPYAGGTSVVYSASRDAVMLRRIAARPD